MGKYLTLSSNLIIVCKKIHFLDFERGTSKLKRGHVTLVIPPLDPPQSGLPISSVSVHGLLDFNEYTPSNATLQTINPFPAKSSHLNFQMFYVIK